MRDTGRTLTTLIILAWLGAVGCRPGGGPTPVAIPLEPTADFASDFAEPEGRPLALEDYYRVKNVGSPSLSPDADWVAFTVSVPIEATNETLTEAWLVPFDGSAEARRVSQEGADISRLRWGDDGRLRWSVDDVVWSIDPRDPRGRRVREGAVEPDRGVPSPDGAWLAELRDTPPPETEVSYPSEFIRRHEERFQGAIWDWMYFQRDGLPMPVPDPTDPRATPPQEVFLVGAGEGGEAMQLTELGLRPGSVRWSPDGSYLVFTADSSYRDESVYGRDDLWKVELDGNVTRLTPDDGFTNGSPVFSPDGRYIALIRSYRTDMVIAERLSTRGPRDLYLLDTGTGELRNLTADWDLRAGTPEWTPDGAQLYFTAGIGGARHLFRVPAAGGPVEQVTTGERRLQGLDHDDAFQRMVYRVGTLEAPWEIFAASMDGSGERQLTRINSEFTAEVSLSRSERLVYRSSDGTLIEGWLLYPYGYDPDGGPYPLIVHSHGGPHSASGYSFNLKHHYFAAHGYFVLQTNFRGSTGYGDAFTYATWGAWGDRDGEDVMAGVDMVLSNFPVDSGRVAAIGHSYGGFMSNWLITRYPDRFAAAAVGAGISNWVSDYGTADIAVTKETEFYGTPWQEGPRNRLIRQSPLIYADRVRAATLFLHGEVDHRVPFEEAEQMYFAIKKQGVPAKMIQYAGQSHGGWGHWNNVHRAYHELGWFDEHLGS